MRALWNSKNLDDFADWTLPSMPYALSYGRQADQWVLIKTVEKQSPFCSILQQEFKWLEWQEGSSFPQPLLWQEDREHCQALYLVKACQPLAHLLAQSTGLKERLEWSLLVADALIEVHRLGHLLLSCSPANCLIRDDGEGAFFWDWTQAYHRKEQRYQLDLRPEPLAFYARAPEMLGEIERAPELSADVYGLGVTIAHICAAQPLDSSDPVKRLPALFQHFDLAWECPPILVKIMMRSTEKTPLRRYQTAWGLRSDLRELYAELNGRPGDLSWELGRRDTLDVLTFKEHTIYGRDVELAELDVAFQRFIQGESVSYVLTGGVGVGKSALIEHFMLQHKSDACLMTQVRVQARTQSRPFGPLIAALENLIKQLLLKPQREMLVWRKKILDAVGENSALMVELIPDLAYVLDHHEKIACLPPREETLRFAFTLRNFLGAFCQKEHPVLLHISDGQWLDHDTLDLLRSYLEKEVAENLFLIVSYLPGTQDAPCSLDQLKGLLARGFVHSFVMDVPHLSPHSIERYLSDILACEQERAEGLAALIYQKTKGVPALMRNMLKGLWEQGALAFDYRSFNFIWNLSKAQGWQIDEGLIQALINEINKFSPASLDMLGIAACFMREFSSSEMEDLLDATSVHVAMHLRQALNEGIVIPIARGDGDREELCFRFAHEEIRAVVYSRLPDEERRLWHRRLSDFAARQAPSEGQQHMMVLQANLSLSPEGGEVSLPMAELNLKLARRARSSGSFSQALRHLKFAKQWLGIDRWTEHYGLCLRIHEESATTALLAQDREGLHEIVNEAISHVRDPKDTFVIYEMQMVAAMNEDLTAALAIARPVWKEVGLHVPLKASALRVHFEMLKTYVSLKAAGKLEDKVESDSLVHSVALRMAARLAPQLENHPSRLAPLLWARALSFGLRRGIAPSLPYVHAQFARKLIGRYGLYSAAFSIAKSAEALARRFDDSRVDGLLHGFIHPWNRQLNLCLVGLLRSFRRGLECGEYEAAGQAILLYGHYSFAAGLNLERLLEELVAYRGLVMDLGDLPALWHIDLLRQTLVQLTLGGRGAQQPLAGSIFGREAIEDACRKSETLHFYYHLNLLILQVFTHKGEAVVQPPLPASLSGCFGQSCMVFYGAFANVRLCERGLIPASDMMVLLRSARESFKRWERHRTAHPSHRLLLLDAELARWSHKPFKALSLYARAIELAKETKVLHESALALEQLARLFHGLRLELLARDYLEKALQTYAAWGAPDLVLHIRTLYRSWDLGRFHEKLPEAQREVYGLEYLQRSLSEITRETDPKILIEKILQTAVHLTKAERGHFMIKRFDEKLYKVKQSYEDGVFSYPDVHYVQLSELCRSIVNYVLRTKRTTVIDDAQIPQKAVPGLERDPYVLDKVVRSLACLPIEIGNSNEREMVAILYLENNSYSHTFSADRLQFLALIGQAAAGRLEIYEKAFSLEESLKEAELVQRALLPSIQEMPGFTIADFFKPAQQTGGDWYGYCEDKLNSRAYFFVGDVTGHGVSSALITGTAAGSAYSAIAALQGAKCAADLSETLLIIARAVNQAVFATAAKVDKMMTMAFIGMDTKTGEIAFINAAHPHGFIVSDQRARPLMGRGSPLGFSADPDYKALTFQLKKSDFLFFYSDGLMENKGPEGERLQARALIKILESSSEPGAVKRDIMERTDLIWQDAPAEDDCAFVIIRWDGPIAAADQDSDPERAAG